MKIGLWRKFVLKMHFGDRDGIDSELLSGIDSIVNCGEDYSAIESVVPFREEEGSIEGQELDSDPCEDP